ncbi:MAG: flavodoxin-dependent (E)-4-hydroxy-3-methylbut-2-enyl-diphosphate synthase [Thermoanaerobaculales bacterium]|jgi:(E)-4-hydroxy-3-methylbut-2-enyl-diphosphate synthase|nr:flavodoxin-dependent (E)-4-hydroxy-3-methylbut-2-enyl-diphosphate synthase [Thermoanaerobaculales bacterium]
MQVHRSTTIPVEVGGVVIGGGAPVVVQSMTDTDTANAAATADQCRALADAGAELVRITVNSADAARAVPEIRRRLSDSGPPLPLIGDFHFNGHVLLAEHPECAEALDKYRINPGNVGEGRRRDPNLAAICAIARDRGKAIRVGGNTGSLDRRRLTEAMAANAATAKPLPSSEVLGQLAVDSVLVSVEAAVNEDLPRERIIVSCKTSSPTELVSISRRLAASTRQPLHLGLTEAGMGTRGLVRSAAVMGILLADGIGDTIRVSVTPRPGGDRTEEVTAARELLQSLGLRAFSPTITACPGCGRTGGDLHRRLADLVERRIERRVPEWKAAHPGAEELTVAVMGCVVNGPGESRNADIGISLPGPGEAPRCPVYVEAEQVTTLSGDAEELAERFIGLVDDYVAKRWG